MPLEGGADGGRRGVDNSDDLRPMSVCEELAPRDRHTDSSPALWAAIGPPRHAHSTRDWGGHMEQASCRGRGAGGLGGDLVVVEGQVGDGTECACVASLGVGTYRLGKETS